PPSPCKVCGSPNHWDKECGHFGEYLERRKRGALIAYDRSPDEETLYEAVYTAIHVNEPAFSAYDWGPATRALAMLTRGREQPLIEEVEDEEESRARTAPKWTGPGLLQEAEGEPFEAVRQDDDKPPEDEAPALEESSDTEDEDDEGHDGFPEGGPTVQAAVFAQAMAASATISELAGPPPQDAPLRNPNLPASECIVRMPKKRLHKPGQSAKGISVLTCRARIGSMDEAALDTTMDSGASLTLAHKPFLQSLKYPPKIRKGMKVCIAQLTSNTPSIEGYVTLSLFVRAEDGAMLEFKIEAYVVPTMTVPLLLGEDWHQNYELDVLRSVEHASSLAHSYSLLDPYTAHFVRAKGHRRAKATWHRRKAALGNGELRVFKDVVVHANSTTMVDFASDLPLEREWFVERNLVCVGRDTFLTVPNCLISTMTARVELGEEDATAPRRSVVPISNPTGSPYLLRAGAVLGHAKDPERVLNSPKDEEQLQQCQEQAGVLAALM
ncbi:hypothetical protein AURDEDRAFT_47993, partial [Auricularia subglabra TFB-10046 SS5]